MAKKQTPYSITIVGSALGKIENDYVVQKVKTICRDMPVVMTLREDKPARPKRAPKSRPARWHDAVSRLRAAHDALEAAAADYDAALEDIEGIKSEYEDWHGNMPESLQQSATGEKLETIINLDTDTKAADAITDLTNSLDEIEAAELPAGFGRD